MQKVVILGPESTGKSTLCDALATHYDTTWCPEFAREYLHQLDRRYTYGDLLNIAHGQLELEDMMLSTARNGIYFIDTDMYVMKVWCEVAFETCHPWILRQIAARRYDLYLLCDVDLPWEHDVLREYPDLRFREKIFKMYYDLVVQQRTPWAVVSGKESQRLQTAISIIDTVLHKKDRRLTE
ncbi:MAG TPA: ATP-binding protein [Flavisolibacter sp.]